METLNQTGGTIDSAVRTDPIIVATDGLPQSRGALAMARALAAPLQGTINVVAVHQSSAFTAPDGQLLKNHRPPPPVRPVAPRAA